jgi:hypothetical protein
MVVRHPMALNCRTGLMVVLRLYPLVLTGILQCSLVLDCCYVWFFRRLATGACWYLIKYHCGPWYSEAALVLTALGDVAPVRGRGRRCCGPQDTEGGPGVA